MWTKFDTEHKYRTINTPEWPNSHKLTPWILENVNNYELDRAICANFYGQMHHGHAEMTKAKTRNRNFFAWRHYYAE